MAHKQKFNGVPVTICETSNEIGNHVADEIAAGIKQAHAENRKFLLGCPGGRSLQSTYDALAKLLSSSSSDISRLVIVMMDDYVIKMGSAYVNCSGDAHYSCRRFGREKILNILNAGVPPQKQIPECNFWNPDPANPSFYDERIRQAGGIDIFLIASGASDGHVAFNPPGTQLDSFTRIVTLAHTTRRDNLGTFPEFASIKDVPRFGVTVGLGTITRMSQRVILVIHGEHKRNAGARLFQCKDFVPSWPASVIFICKRPAIFLDHYAIQGVLL